MERRRVVGLIAGSMLAMTLGGPGLPAAASTDVPWAPTPVELTAPDGEPDEQFGSAVAVDGDTMVAAAVCDGIAGGSCDGAAYVFVRSGSGWVEQARLVPSDIAVSDQFGQSVAVSGNTIVIGSLYDRVAGRGITGSASVFVRTGTTWTEQAKLVPPDGRTYDFFGTSVAVDGDTVVIGSPGHDLRDIVGAGAAYVFVRTDSIWTLQARLLACDRAQDDFFGNAVALQSNTALVGSYNDSSSDVGGHEGSAYVFLRSAGSWHEQAKLVASDAAGNAFFGTSVALDGGTAVIGDQPNSQGRLRSTYVFVRAGTSWTQQATLHPSDGQADDFGSAVDVSGSVVVVGAYSDNPGGFPSAGSAYVYTRAGTTWAQRAKLTAADPARYEQYGEAVSLDAGTVVIGAPLRGIGGTVFIYQGPAPPL